MANILTEGGEFSVTPGEEMWTAGNARVGLTVVSSSRNQSPSTRLNDEPALCWISNAMKPFMEGTPQEQTLMAELNGVFAHIKVISGRVYVVMADRRLE